MFYLQCRPCSTDAIRHVLDISDNQTSVISLWAMNANAVAPTSTSNIIVINTHINKTVLIGNQAHRRCCIFVNIGDIALAWVGLLF